MSGVCPESGGSSPLARGKLRLVHLRRTRRGLIPARAGKTGKRPSVSDLHWAHPRSRGENRGFIRGVGGEAGSSPLARGKPARVPASIRPARLIPARAGKTSAAASMTPEGSAHPRSRGENQGRSNTSPLGAGSSPRARGKPMMVSLSGWEGGLIPARAGKTSRGARAARTCRAHPRSRRENPWYGRTFETGTGSSPLARGKHEVRLARVRVDRLIPARAGKTG